MQKINFQKLDKNLKKYSKQESSSNCEGLAKVIHYVWNHYPTSEVDFDSFTYSDVIVALQSFQEIPCNDEEFEVDNPDYQIEDTNPWLHNRLAENACYNLHHTKNKIYENDDDFI